MYGIKRLKLDRKIRRLFVDGPLDSIRDSIAKILIKLGDAVRQAAVSYKSKPLLAMSKSLTRLGAKTAASKSIKIKQYLKVALPVATKAVVVATKIAGKVWREIPAIFIIVKCRHVLLDLAKHYFGLRLAMLKELAGGAFSTIKNKFTGKKASKRSPAASGPTYDV